MMATMSLVPDPAFLAMPDSIQVADLPYGFEAYLGYADGEFTTVDELAAAFPQAHRVILTVTGTVIQADGIDCEPGNVNAADARVWVQRKLAAAPQFRPVVYASVKGQPNFGMGDVLAALSRNGVGRSRVRLLSAHYGAGPHICGPDTCKLIGIPMDGTQWTDEYPGPGGSRIDMSMLRADFFGPVAETGTERIVRELGTVREGDSGEAVKTVQGLCVARGAIGLVVDGVFGEITRSAVEHQQNIARITQDGVVGPLTWPVLLGVA